MLAEKPYNPPRETDLGAEETEPNRDDTRWMTIGLVVGALLPFAWGVYGLVQFKSYAASVESGAVICGTPVLGSLTFIILGTPFGAIVGAGIGRVISAVKS